jgi:TonB family protein
MRFPPRAFFLLLLGLLFPILSSPQDTAVPQTASQGFERVYENSAAGLRWQLQDILNSARAHNRVRLDALIKGMEIPDYGDWFINKFGREKGQGWAGAYGQNLAENEKDLSDLIGKLADQDGEFYVRRINDQPAPARKVEQEMIDSLQRPVDIFFAAWMPRGVAQGTKSSPVGYFVFLDGTFRLDSAIRAADLRLEPGADAVEKGGLPAESTPMRKDRPETRPETVTARAGVAGVGYPTCDYCPDPAYTKVARDNRLEGTVVLQAVIRPNGDITDVQVIKSPDPELTQMAIDGVGKWHMNPARLADGEPVAVLVPFEITFRLRKSK